MAVVGLGPVGGVLVALLAATGVDVVAVDAAPAPVPTPRAVALDDEVLRLLSWVPGLDVGPLTGRPRAEFAGPGGELLAAIDFDGRRHAQPGLAFFHQPTLERALRARVGDRLAVDRVERLDQRGGTVRLGLASGTTLHARWVVGCDGTASTVRRLLAVGFPGRTLRERWLVRDAEGPPVSDTFRYVCDPARPAVSVPVPGGHRWEWAAGAGTPPPPPPGLRVTREAEYAFHARAAGAWRSGRVLLAGDAAHAMPPFAGQGLGAGLRDAAGLAWRLHAVLRGAPEALLDGYARERAPHVRAMTRTALLAGAVVQTRDERLGRAVRGLLRRAGSLSGFRSGRLRPRDRRLVANPWLEVDGEPTRLDALLALDRLVPLRRAGRRVLVGGRPVRDLDGWLDAAVDAGGVAVRPDRVLVRAG